MRKELDASIAEQLASHSARLPVCVVKYCCVDDPSELRDFFWYPSNIVLFGERLIHTAGLALAALYLRERKIGKDCQPDAIFEDLLRQVLFGRGYDRGHACAVVQRGGFISIGSFGEVLKDNRIVTRFIEGMPARASNFLRAEVEHPVGYTLLALLQGLDFLSVFSFEQEGTVAFRGERLVVSPFLSWDGCRLSHFRRLITVRPGHYTIEQSTDSTSNESVQQTATGLMVSQLTEIAFILGVPNSVFDGSATVGNDARPVSIFPTSAHKQPQLGHLAQLVLKNSEPATRLKLLTHYYPKYSREDVETRLASPDGDIFFTNEIFVKCLEEDPVAVLEEYFELEPRDPRVFIEDLTEAASVAAIESAIRAAVKEHRQRVQPFFCLPQHATQCEHHIREYESRIAAQKIVMLMGFDIVEVMPVEDVVLYIQRVRALAEYVARGQDGNKEMRIGNGLLACCSMCEQILSFLYRYYRLLPFFELESAAGVSAQGHEARGAIAREVSSKGLGTLIDKFFGLARHADVQDAVQRLLGRSGIWPVESDVVPREALGRLNQFRICRVHVQESRSAFDTRELLEGCLSFLDWLLDPGAMHEGMSIGLPDQYPLRIYPAVVALNLQTLTRSGIMTLKYKLRNIDDGTVPVTLFTNQDVSIKSCYYGLAHVKDRFHHCWNNPVLIQTDVLTEST